MISLVYSNYLDEWKYFLSWAPNLITNGDVRFAASKPPNQRMLFGTPTLGLVIIFNQINILTLLGFRYLLSTTYLLTYVLTYLPTYSTKQSPYSDPNRFSASQEIPHISWNPKVHYRVYKGLSPGPIFSQINPVPSLIPLPEYPF